MADEVKKGSETKGAGEADALNAAIERGIDAWREKVLLNSPFSGDTPAWNHFFEHRGALVEAIAKEVK